MRVYTGLGGGKGIRLEGDEHVDLYEAHPTPWKVVYKPMFSAWHRLSQPQVEDVNGVLVMKPMQYVDHPGLHDCLAIQVCNALVEKANAENLY